MEILPWNPDSWMDVVALLVVAAPGIIGAIVAMLNRRDGKAIKGQVVNGHTDPLRSDLDRVLLKLNDVHDTLTDHGGRLNSIESHLRRKH